jgi:hypothetical protein
MHKTLGAAVVAMAATGWLPAQKLDQPFRVTAGGAPIEVEVGHAHPYVYDFDRDGKRDLLVGQFGQGRLRIYKNLGSDKRPEFDKFEWFEAAGEIASVKAG